MGTLYTPEEKDLFGLLAHTGQNYDYNLNSVFFKDLKLADPDIYMEAVGSDLGDTNSCLNVIGAKRLPEETNRRIVDIISDVKGTHLQ